MEHVAGRQHEQARIADALDVGRSVLLAGSMGVGKSHLMAAVAANHRAAGWAVTTIVANPASATMPFGAVATLVDTAASDDRHSMLRAAVDAFQASLAGRRPLIALDDAQYLDSGSLALLHELCVADDVPFVATMRSGEDIPEGVLALWKDSAAERIELGPLDADAVHAIVDRELGADATAVVVNELHQRSQGNPLFLIELIRAQQAHVPSGLTPKLIELVRARLDRLDPEVADQLRFVAVADPLDTDLPVVDVDRLAQLEAEGLVQTYEADGAVFARPSHPVYGEVVRSQFSALTRRFFARQIGDALLARPITRRGETLRLATCMLDAGDRPAAPLAVKAAFEALGFLEPELATRLATIAVEEDPSYPSLFALAEIRRIAGDVEHAAVWFARAFDRASADHELREVSMALAQLHGFYLGDPASAVAVLEQSANRMSTRAERLNVEIERALFASMLGRYEDVLLAAREVFREPDVEEGLAWNALTNLTWAQAQLTDLEAIDANLSAGLKLVATQPPERIAEVDLLHAVRVNVRMEQGRLAAALDRAEEFGRSGAPAGLTAFSAANVAWIGGHSALARSLTDEALDHLRAFDAFNALPFTLGFDACVAYAAGEADRAETAVAEAIDRDGLGATWGQIWIGRAQAWAHAAAGRIDDAVEGALAAGEIGIETTHYGWAQLVLHDAAIWGGGAAAADALDRAAVRLHEAPLMAAMVEHARALATDDVAALVDLGERFGDALAVRFRAATWAGRAARIDDPQEAARLATRARLTLGPASLPVSVARIGVAGRRLEVAERALAGDSSKEIAEALFLSTRTVDNHLRAVYRALGISGRADLADVLGGED